jgi:hypothetical protein
MMRMPRRRDHRVNHGGLAYVSLVRSAFFPAYSILVVRSSQQCCPVLATPHREARRVPAGKPARVCGPPLFLTPRPGCRPGNHRAKWPWAAICHAACGGLTAPLGRSLRSLRGARAPDLDSAALRGLWPCPLCLVSERFLTGFLCDGSPSSMPSAALLKSTPSPGRSSRQCIALRAASRGLRPDASSRRTAQATAMR